MYNEQQVLERILAAIASKGVTKKEALLKSGINTSFLTDWEKGRIKNPGIDKLVRLTSYLNVSLDYMVLGNNISSPDIRLCNAEQELLDVFNRLDRRGQSKLYTVMYEEADRVAAASRTAGEAAATSPQKTKLPPNYPVDEYGDPLVPWAASGWADITPENAEKFQQKLQAFERKNREYAEKGRQQRLLREQEENKK